MSIEVELKCKRRSKKAKIRLNDNADDDGRNVVVSTLEDNVYANDLLIHYVRRTASNYRKYDFQIFVDYIN